MPAATIAGKTYNTVIMPDGKEWMAEHLRDTSAGGVWYGGSEANAYLGRHYKESEVLAMSYPGGWRVPTKADMDGLNDATGVAYRKARRFCSPDNWSSAFAVNCLDTYGFSFGPTGWNLSGWFFENRFGRIWYGLDDPTYSWILSIDANNNGPVNWMNYVKGTSDTAAVRLVRDATPNLYVPHTGAWKRPTSIHVPHAGAWKQASQIFVPVNGEWKSL